MRYESDEHRGLDLPGRVESLASRRKQRQRFGSGERALYPQGIGRRSPAGRQEEQPQARLAAPDEAGRVQLEAQA
jgi:hypothetical protein